ncbi:MAG: hypothetical protein JNJ54_36925 [Myxococcaceae bacterium]|nr:hypothetical protein [Myxococcaceae bacterium]
MNRLFLLCSVQLLGCATARLIGDRPPMTPLEAGPPRIVVVEPLFDRAEWKTTMRTEPLNPSTPPDLVGMPSMTQAPNPFQPGSGALLATSGTGAYSSSGSAGRQNAWVAYRTVTEKPLFGRPETLAAIHERLLPVLKLLRPNWTFVAPGLAPTLTRDVVVVRTLIDGNEQVQSDRSLKNAAFAFGLVLLPLQILAAFPVEETQRVSGQLEKVPVDPKALAQRLVTHTTQPDFAVNLSGLPAKQQAFALDVQYEEGLFADETPRPGVLIDGFVEKLAWAIVAFVEEESP